MKRLHVLIIILLFSACKVTKNADIDTCYQHKTNLKKGYAKNSYGWTCNTQEGDLRKIGNCGSCIRPRNVFKRYTYIKYCPKCHREWTKSKNKANIH
jgi:hypothetical protein